MIKTRIGSTGIVRLFSRMRSGLDTAFGETFDLLQRLLGLDKIRGNAAGDEVAHKAARRFELQRVAQPGGGVAHPPKDARADDVEAMDHLVVVKLCHDLEAILRWVNADDRARAGRAATAPRHHAIRLDR